MLSIVQFINKFQKILYLIAVHPVTFPPTRALAMTLYAKWLRNPEEAVEIIELGFEFVNEINGSYLYRKRK